MNQINQNVLLFSCELQQPKKSLEIIHDGELLFKLI